jgi:hypothetical protein
MKALKLAGIVSQGAPIANAVRERIVEVPADKIDAFVGRWWRKHQRRAVDG